jgi:hypothetical protein
MDTNWIARQTWRQSTAYAHATLRTGSLEHANTDHWIDFAITKKLRPCQAPVKGDRNATLPSDSYTTKIDKRCSANSNRNLKPSAAGATLAILRQLI